ncbi:MAG: hypothetical protein M3439_03115 [Chloroflexota bacterium]|nr:hypothetical protein [Chloroflexota bacterium]
MSSGPPDDQPPDHDCQYDADLLSSEELALLAALGGAFDWLVSEPDRYSLEDGEPV